MLRGTLLFLSRRRRLRRWMETSSTAELFTRRFVAGRTLEQALAVCRKLNAEGILATLDHLGENVTSAEEAAASRDAYLAALRLIAERKLDASVSIKLTQFGLDLSYDLCRENVECLVSMAKQLGGFVEVDMESSEYVDRTLALVAEMHARYRSVRAVIQAYLRRSADDIVALCRKGVPVRLCKGAYNEPASIAYPVKKAVNENFVHLAKTLLANGVYPGLATHDPDMVAAARRFAEGTRIPKRNFEFQMLYGIRRDLQRQLVAAGYRLRLYVPYGDGWYPYLMRRLAERPANVLFILRNLLRR
jgi:proline dehydrogenase